MFIDLSLIKEFFLKLLVLFYLYPSPEQTTSQQQPPSYSSSSFRHCPSSNTQIIHVFLPYVHHFSTIHKYKHRAEAAIYYQSWRRWRATVSSHMIEIGVAVWQIKGQKSPSLTRKLQNLIQLQR